MRFGFLLSSAVALLSLLVLPTLTVVAQNDDWQVVNLPGEFAGSTFRYKINLDDPAADGEDTITVEFSVPGSRWLGLGPSEEGNMPGSEVVIGMPTAGTVRKYSLQAYGQSGVVAMPEGRQTLINTDLTQAGGRTTMTYTKILQESGELAIDAPGSNRFVAAYGSSNSFGFHSVYDSFSFNAVLPSIATEPPITESPTSSPTAAPTASPTVAATPRPSAIPSIVPITAPPTSAPVSSTPLPTVVPATEAPSMSPVDSSSEAPTVAPVTSTESPSTTSPVAESTPPEEESPTSSPTAAPSPASDVPQKGLQYMSAFVIPMLAAVLALVV